MKKITAILLAMIMLLSLCACSGKEETPSGEEEISPEEFVYIRGTVEDNFYRNSCTGISFDAPEGWTYFSDEEIAEIMGVSMDYILSEDTADKIDEIGVIYDMYCVDEESGAAVNVNSENMALVYNEIIEETYYLTLVSAQVESQLSGGNVTIHKNEPGIAKTASGDVPCIYITMEFSGITFYEAVMAKSAGGYMTSVTVAAMEEEQLGDIISLVDFQ